MAFGEVYEYRLKRQSYRNLLQRCCYSQQLLPLLTYSVQKQYHLLLERKTRLLPEKTAIMPSKLASELLDFDMDRYVNPWLPHNRVGYLPAPISRFLGYRKNAYKEPPALIQWFSAFVGAFIGILIVGAIFRYAPGVTNHHPPVIVASLGASAILDYSAIRSPVAQPRNSVLGQGLSAIVGVAIAKLFMLNSDFQNIQWIAGAVACACAALVMCATNTVHPPGGATAVIATTQANVISMGWWYVPITLLGAVVMLVVALLWNNVLRQFPVFWWTPAEVGGKLSKSHEKDEEKDVESEKKADRQNSDSSRYVSSNDISVEIAHQTNDHLQPKYPTTTCEPRFYDCWFR
jgi:hypothetical protein